MGFARVKETAHPRKPGIRPAENAVIKPEPVMNSATGETGEPAPEKALVLQAPQRTRYAENAERR